MGHQSVTAAGVPLATHLQAVIGEGAHMRRDEGRALELLFNVE